MSSFRQQLETLLVDARNRSIIDRETEDAILALSASTERARGVGRLTITVSILGAFGLLLGIILLLAANWGEIPAFAKLGAFLASFLASHCVGLFLRWKHPGYPATAETFSFLGGGLFLAGLALVSQIYHINSYPTRGVAIWFFAVLPLGFLLVSTPLMVMAAIAGLIWLHLGGFVWGAGFFAVIIPLETGIAVVLIGGSSLLRRMKSGMGTAFVVIGGLILAAMVYCMGFFRYMDNRVWWGGSLYEEYAVNQPWLCLVLLAGVAMVAAGFVFRITASAWTNRALAILLVLTLLVSYLDMSVLYGSIGGGELVDFFNFGLVRFGHFRSFSLFLTFCAWILWFAWGLWLVWEGTQSSSNGMVTAGIYSIAIGLVTRYFDIIGTLTETGAVFIAGGIVLILCGWGAEKWRRKLKKSRAGDA